MITGEQRLAWALDTCRRLRLRMTPVRRAVLWFLATRHTPGTLEMIAGAEGVCGHCDATTVYRTLVLFEAAELVRRVSTPRRTGYFILNAPNAGSHFLVCRECGKIAALPLSPAVEEQINQASTAQGFSTAGPHYDIHSLCWKCKTARQNSVAPSKLIL